MRWSTSTSTTSRRCAALANRRWSTTTSRVSMPRTRTLTARAGSTVRVRADASSRGDGRDARPAVRRAQRRRHDSAEPVQRRAEELHAGRPGPDHRAGAGLVARDRPARRGRGQLEEEGSDLRRRSRDLLRLAGRPPRAHRPDRSRYRRPTPRGRRDDDRRPAGRGHDRGVPRERERTREAHSR